jgi:hypothetical protein
VAEGQALTAISLFLCLGRYQLQKFLLILLEVDMSEGLLCVLWV